MQKQVFPNITFQEIKYGLDSLGQLYQIFEYGYSTGKGKDNDRELEVWLSPKDKENVKKILLTLLEDKAGSPFVSAHPSTFIIKDSGEIKQTASHNSIFWIIEKNAEFLQDTSITVLFKIVPGKIILHSGGTSTKYHFRLEGKIKDNGVLVQESYSDYSYNIVEVLKEISKIRMFVQSLQAQRGEPHTQDISSKSVINPNYTNMQTYELNDKILAKKIVEFFEKKYEIRKCELTKSKSGIVTNAYNHELTSAIAQIKLVEEKKLIFSKKP